ncbi:MAG: PilZ domain-containing protein [Elusimicrobia bacterium]|nr:PilZ domain-containing protein [Elusimicrobiota bacterium]
MFRFLKQLGRSLKKDSSGWDGKTEKRRAPRVRVTMVNVCFLEGPREEFGDGTVIDLSETGICFSSDSRLSAGSNLIVKVHFPRDFTERTPAQLRAAVVRYSRMANRRLYKIACRITGGDPASLRRLQAFALWASQAR